MIENISQLVEGIVNSPVVFWGGLIIILIAVLFFYLLNKLAKTQQLLLEENTAILEQSKLSSEIQKSTLQQIFQQIAHHSQQTGQQHAELKNHYQQDIAKLKLQLLRQQAEQSEKLQSQLHSHQQQFNLQQSQGLEQMLKHLNDNHLANREEQRKSLVQANEQMSKSITELTESTNNRLKEISEQVEKRLAEGFDKTTKTFNDIVKRLALIDDAQKKITELSSNVVSLQEVLADKRSRGAFGEVQLNSLIRNVLPEQHFALQHNLSNGKIADCALFLPPPTGTVIIDAKFPLESFRKMTELNIAQADKKIAERQFKTDIKKHINDISSKYLIENETSDGAIMFIPAEAIFAEIHSHHSDLVDYANSKRIWLTSPTTLMAILTTARSVLKDEATKEQVHIIRAHLAELANDFGRFKTRFNNLAKHIDQAASDVKQIHTSADKISTRFEKIEQVDLVQVKMNESALLKNNN